MSYCRCGPDSDVYVYSSSQGWNVYLSFEVPPYLNGREWHPRTRKATVMRLLGLRTAGYRIPERALERLRREMHPDQIGERP